MKSLVYCLVAWLAVGLMAACSKNDDDEPNMDTIPPFNYTIVNPVYDGVWTVDQQVVDTARLEVSTDMKIRLPEDYLADFCLSKLKAEAEKYSTFNHPDVIVPDFGIFMTIDPNSIEPKGVPVTLINTEQGYSEKMQYYNTDEADKLDHASLSFANNLRALHFYVTMDGTEYRIDLLSNEGIHSIYREDTGLWTIGIESIGFLVTDLNTNMQWIALLYPSITLYYNAKSRIN